MISPLKVKAQALPRHIVIGIATSILLISTVSFVYLWKTPGVRPIQQCGLSPQDARTRRCKFDPMSFSWFPPDCYDGELTSQFLAEKEWGWYGDPRAQHSIALSEVQEGHLEYVFVSKEFHLFHCTYMWKKMHRAILSGSPIDGYISNLNHTAHCVKELLSESGNLNRTTTMIFTKYVECGRGEESDNPGWYRMEHGRKILDQPSLAEFMHN